MTPTVTPLTAAQLKLASNQGGCYGSGPGVLTTNDGQLTFKTPWAGSYEFNVFVYKGSRFSNATFTIIVTPYSPPVMILQ